MRISDLKQGALPGILAVMSAIKRSNPATPATLPGQHIQMHCFHGDFRLVSCPSTQLILDLSMTDIQGHLKTHGEAITNGLENAVGLYLGLRR
jgi:hypothetical protein